MKKILSILLILFQINFISCITDEEEKEFNDAIISGDINTVKKLANSGMNLSNPSRFPPYYRTPISLASEKGYKEIVHFLITQYNLSLNYSDSGSNIPPIIYAILNQHYDIVKMLIKAGASLKNHYHYTVLTAAATTGNIDLAKIFLALDIDVNSTTESGLSPLMSAAKRGHMEMVKFLISIGANLYAMSKDSKNLLMFACESGNIELVKLFLSYNIDINHRGKTYNNEHDKTGWDNDTPLIIAAEKGYKDIVELLLAQKADPYLTGVWDKNALIAATIGGNIELVKLFLQYNFDINAKHEHARKSALVECCYLGHVEILKLFLSQNIDIHHENNFEALHYALMQKNKNIEIISLLIKAGADINRPRCTDATPLFYALCDSYPPNNNYEIVKLLIDNGASINSINKDYPPLTQACFYRNKECVKLLLSKGADVHFKDKSGKNALGSSIDSHTTYDLEIVEILLQAGIDPNSLNIYKTPFLTYFAEKGDLDAVNLFLKYNADPNLKPLEDSIETPLFSASIREHIKIVEALLKAGAKVNIKSSYNMFYNNQNDYRTEFTCAAANGLPKVTKLLLDYGANLFDLKGYRLHEAKRHPETMAVLYNHLNIIKNNLYDSIKNGDLEKFKFYLKKIGSFQIKDKNNNNLVHYIVHYYDNALDNQSKNQLMSILAYILSFESNLISKKNRFGLTPIDYSLQNNKINLFKQLISKFQEK